ncbi:ribosome maturation factor RimP [Pajaroellobacter abortibovis]|uniref:Ribosome maturation factor RimP n=1 Tax=Pajaroellobacter abortibovis TaxID=1882918 RepID=A0A1L6MVJ2_9BACT|nr:ribosome maturation factor RimP [Pajaroellobacter abortibovis]APR99494.1 hypothetical protein BCY86_01450 [Pajaroellobacter abortibovis]
MPELLTFPSLSRVDRSTLEPIIQPIVHAHGAELVDIEFRREPQGWTLRVIVEKLGSEAQNLSTKEAGVDLELCANIAKEVSPALDVLDQIPHRYHLEISSPGVERHLRTPKDFVRFVGQKATLKLQAPLEGKKIWVGWLRGVRDDHLLLEEEEQQCYEIPFCNIVSGHLLFEFGSFSCSPRKASRRKKSKR